MPSFLIRELQLSTVLLLICDSYMSWSTRFVSLKLCVRFSTSHSVSLLLKFFSTECMNSLTLKHHNSFQKQNSRKATHSFSPRPLIFKLQQEVLKFSYIFVSWSSLKADLGTNLLNLENWSFENISFFQ